MPSTPTLFAFAAATVLLGAIPGPNLLYIVGTGIGSGRRIAVASALGVEVGTLVHILAAALGLSAVLSAAPVAFDVVRYLGVAYLVFLAVVAFRSTPGLNHTAQPAALPFGRAFRRGVVVNVLNPKVSLFFLAFLPQFVEPGVASPTAQILVLGLVFFAVALAIDLAYAAASGTLGGWLSRRPRIARWQGRFTGTVYLALAATAAATGVRSTQS